MNEERGIVLHGRRRDRRGGLHAVLATVARVATARAGPAPLRGAFEDALRRAVGARTVHLRDLNSRWRGEPARGGESMAFDVPASSPLCRGILEASIEPGRPQSEWEAQTLTAAAHLAALVLEIERARSGGGRGDNAGMPPRLVDSAAALIGTTTAMQQLRDSLTKVAGTEFTVLLEGESGVGKELVARQIHDLSPRRDGPFVAINCAALVETLLEAELFGIEERTATGVRGRRGKFEHADGGTLFLDEVGDLSLTAQAKLLRAIQDMAVERVGGQGSQRLNIRIVAATNRSLSEMVTAQSFRADLYYRLSGVDVRVPTLRERRADVGELAQHFLRRLGRGRELRFSESALQALSDYDWPGNVRELERLVERVVALCAGPAIEVRDLPSRISGEFTAALLPSLQRNEALRTWASRYARLVYERCDGNKRKAARRLGISNHTLSSYLRHATPAGAPQLLARVHEQPDAYCDKPAGE